jgi:cystinosin
VAVADLAFSLHALVVSAITLAQVLYYGWKNRQKASDDGEREPLIRGEGGSRSIVDLAVSPSAIKPSLPFQILLVGIAVSTFGAGIVVWIGKAEFLDWLYFVSSLKLVITTIKYLPQILLNYRLKSTAALAIGVILLVS